LSSFKWKLLKKLSAISENDYQPNTSALVTEHSVVVVDESVAVELSVLGVTVNVTK